VILKLLSENDGSLSGLLAAWRLSGERRFCVATMLKSQFVAFFGICLLHIFVYLSEKTCLSFLWCLAKTAGKGLWKLVTIVVPSAVCPGGPLRFGETESFGGTMVKKIKPAAPTWRKWKEARRIVLERDNYTCQGCGVKQSKKLRLTIHHTHYHPTTCEEHLEFRFDPSKLISLCEECRDKQHREEKQEGNAPI